jgi:hypothetical protein
MDDFWAIDLERDVNWGDSTYLCMYCVVEIAAIGGYVNEGELAEMTDNVERLRTEKHELEAEFDAYRTRARTILAGEKAKRELAKDADPDTVTPKKQAAKKKSVRKAAA